jgi:hypothetical protein
MLPDTGVASSPGIYKISRENRTTKIKNQKKPPMAMQKKKASKRSRKLFRRSKALPGPTHPPLEGCPT